MELFIQMVVEAVFVLLFVALLAATAFGAAIAVRPALLLRLRVVTDRRIDLSVSTDWLDRPRNIDHVFYRYHYLYGAVVIILAVLLLYLLTFGYERPAVEFILPDGSRVVAEILAETMRLALWILAIFCLAIGVIMLVRPSALKGFERAVNRWLSTKDVARRLDREYHGADTLAQKYPRITGSVVAVVGLVCVTLLITHWGAWIALVS